MAGNQVIEVRLPDGAEPTREDLDLLRSIVDAIVTFRFRPDHPGEEAERTLVGEGWTVRTRLAWAAEARKGSECEQVSGATQAEALRHLLQLVRADRVLSAP
jgi:hypothetical protein